MDHQGRQLSAKGPGACASLVLLLSLLPTIIMISRYYT